MQKTSVEAGFGREAVVNQWKWTNQVDRSRRGELKITQTLMAEAKAKQKIDVLFFFQSLSRGLVTSEYFFLNFDILILNVNKKQIGYTACSILIVIPKTLYLPYQMT